MVPSVLQRGDWAIKLDLAHGKLGQRLLPRQTTCFVAYYHIPIRASHQKYLRFIWKGNVYQFLVLCFGLRTVSFNFQRKYSVKNE